MSATKGGVPDDGRDDVRDDMRAQPEIGFATAIREIEEILAGIEGEEIDLDRLADELKRAAELLELCRAKIRKADVEVTQIVQQLGAPDS